MSKWLPWVLVAVAVFFLWLGASEDGAMKEKIAALEEQRERILAQAHVVDTAYVTDTITLSRLKTRYDTLLVDHAITDTLWVERFVQVADSTIHACSAALNTCEKRVAFRDSVITNLNSTLDLERKRHPSRFGCAAGASANTKGVGPGIACGVRF